MGICGFGWSAQEFHLPLLTATGCIDLVAVYDPVPARRELAASAGAAILASASGLEESVRAAGLDLVLVASPSSMHSAHAEAAIRGGAHVIVEKPAVQSAVEYRRLAAIAHDHDRAVIPFHNRVFDQEHRLVVDVLATGQVGRLLSIESTVARAKPPTRLAAAEFRPQWRLERQFGGGALADWGPHKLDQIVDYAGSAVISHVAARSRSGIWSMDCDDVMDALLEWGDVHVRLLLSYIDRVPRERLRLTGTAGTIRITGSDKTGEVEIQTEGGIERRPYENRVSDWQPLYDVAINAALRGNRGDAEGLWRRAGFVYETIERIREAARPPLRVRGTRHPRMTVTDAIGDGEWDAFVADAPGGTVFHGSGWSGASQRRFLRLGVKDDRGLLAGLVIEDPADDGFRSLAPYSGPMVRADAADASDGLLTRLASALAERLRACMFITSPWAPSLRPFVCSGDFRARLLYSAVVNITDLDTTFASFSSALRGNIRAATRSLLVDDGDGGTAEVLDLVTRTFQRQGRAVWFDSAEAASCLDNLVRRGRARMFLARDGAGAAVGGVAVAWDERRAYYVAGGYDVRHAHRGATSLALWHAMQFVRRIGLHTFDLEGSHIPAIEQFFRQFGATWLPYSVVKREVQT
jgi:predicted dehydrogenase